MGTVEERLSARGWTLPDAPRPVGAYRSAHVLGDLVYTSGQLSWRDGVIHYPGRIGDEVTVEEGREAARIATLNLVAQLKIVCDGDLDRIVGCARMTCHIACTPEFAGHADVIVPVSDVILTAFGDEIGAHARLAYGTPSLPFHSPVEIEGIFRIA